MKYKTSCIKYTGHTFKQFRDELTAISNMDDEDRVEVLRLPSRKGVVKKSIKQLTFFELCLVCPNASTLAALYHGGGNLEFGAETVRLFHIFLKMPDSELKNYAYFEDFRKRHALIDGALSNIILEI
jgi:hypothetical protein